MGTGPHFIITDSESNSFCNLSELQNFTANCIKPFSNFFKISGQILNSNWIQWFILILITSQKSIKRIPLQSYIIKYQYFVPKQCFAIKENDIQFYRGSDEFVP
ncbi:hypothetical protein B1J93_14755 [Leptospira kirschneri serovar Pomona]|uniref:Uncharacterized protein n=1 Tax=Leptospira kirschneri serovar Pomona TaxID=561005 RepID=A0A1T1DJ87_9LEPT|nr:hypothetical protein B1J93_14755 [Leptospira kirschneri serovar Pomona]